MNIRLLKYFDRLLGIIVRKLKRRKNSNIASKPRKILIIKLSAMGDVLCLVPSIRALQSSFPDSRIEFLTTERANPELFEGIPYLRSILLLPTNPALTIIFLIFRSWNFRAYDLIIDYDQYYRISELLAFFGRINVGFSAPLKGNSFLCSVKYSPEENEKILFYKLTREACSFYNKSIPDLDLEIPELLHRFTPSADLTQIVEATFSLRQTIVIYPGSSSNAKFRRWAWLNYEYLINQFLREQIGVIIAGGPDELEFKPKLSSFGEHLHDWIGKWTLLEWAWIFRHHTKLFLGSDGGLYHLADLLGVPTISVFGPSSTQKWRSLHPQSKILSMQLDCQPCINSFLGQVPQTCWKGTSECLSRISPETVLASARTTMKL